MRSRAPRFSAMRPRIRCGVAFFSRQVRLAEMSSLSTDATKPRRASIDAWMEKASVEGGRGGRIRTGGPLVPNQMRYQAALRPDSTDYPPKHADLIRSPPMKTLLTTLTAAFLIVPVTAQTGYTPTQANLAARDWFQNARFGMFIHWGVYSVLGDGEWVMNNRKIPAADYEKLPAFFNPIEFDAAEWVGLAKAAGMKYITITSKHHDGFAMFDSKVSDYNIVARTPWKKDPMKALAEEARRQGLKLFFYYSQLDWHHPDYYPRGRTGQDAGRADQGNWARYLDYMNGQLRELLTNYGDIGGIWFDGWWDRPDADWQLAHTYSLI